MKHTIICCDLCNGRIYKDGYFKCEEGAISIRAKELRRFYDTDGMLGVFTYSTWKRRKYHICPKFVDKIKEVCKGGRTDENT